MILDVETVRQEKRREQIKMANSNKKIATKSPVTQTEEIKTEEVKTEAAASSPSPPAEKKTAKRRGPPSGPKKRYFACFAMGKDETAIGELIEATSLTEAKKAFKETYKMAPLKIIDNPVFPVKNPEKSAIAQVSVTLKSEDIFKMSGNLFSFVYQGWKCFGNGIQACVATDGREFDADQLVMVNAIAPTSDEYKKTKPRLKPTEVLPLSAVENVTPYSP